MPAALRGSTGSILDSLHRRKIFFAHRVIRRRAGSRLPLERPPAASAAQGLRRKRHCLQRRHVSRATLQEFM